MKSCQPEQTKPSIPKAIWVLGIAMFFVNLSSVMVRSVFAVYMKSVLGVGYTNIGFIEGAVEGLSYIMKMMSGVLSDYFRRRKFIIVLGYGFMFFSRPIIALYANISAVLMARVLDRLGNGIQASPRDALVGDLAPKEIRGACYGLRISLGTAGSFAGALFCLLIMYIHNEDYQTVFWLASLPALLAVLILMAFIKEPEKNLHPADHKARHPIHFSDVPRLGRKYWLLMIVVGIFMVAQLGEPLMVLHAHENFDLSPKNIPLILLIYNSTYSLTSYPAGWLSDKLGRYNMLAIGFICLIICDAFLAGATDLWMVFVGIAFSGSQIAITMSIFMSLVADSVPDDLRGTGFGIFYLICALSVLASNWGAGHIAEQYGEPLAFVTSMLIAMVSLGMLLVIKPKKKCQNSPEQTDGLVSAVQR